MTTNNEQDAKLKDIMDKLPPTPAGAVFKVTKLEKVALPHPYCITPKHLEYAGSMYLDAAAIERAERRGAACDICKEAVRRGRASRILPYDEHESPLTLFVAIPDNKVNLNNVPGLHAYLLAVKNADLGIEGFAFPNLTDN